MDENQAVVELDHAVDILQAGKNSPRIGAIRLVNAIPMLRKTEAPAYVDAGITRPWTLTTPHTMASHPVVGLRK
ncbi:MAG: hypothetical protein B7Y27_15455 [Hydrogenophilales bacterium 16-64-40]|nr:MAG: hypothetical protein B7Y27_15455 [Hydrogenophilales bacterium 16-64-40]